MKRRAKPIVRQSAYWITALAGAVYSALLNLREPNRCSIGTGIIRSPHSIKIAKVTDQNQKAKKESIKKEKQ